MSSLSLGVCTPWLSQWTSTSGKLLSQSLQPFFLESNTAFYVWCFLSPKQFLNSQNYHTRFPGHVKSGRLARLPEEGTNYLACEPLFVVMILSLSVECRASLECLLCKSSSKVAMPLLTSRLVYVSSTSLFGCLFCASDYRVKNWIPLPFYLSPKQCVLSIVNGNKIYPVI